MCLFGRFHFSPLTEGLDMSTSPQTIEHLESLYDGDHVWLAKKMFGEYAIYLDGKIVGLVCDDRLFVKALEEAKTVLGDQYQEAPPYPGAKLHAEPTDRFLERRGNLKKLLDTLWEVLPAPKPKVKKARKPA